MAMAFRKIGMDVARAFRKAPGDISRFASKAGRLAGEVESGLGVAQRNIARAGEFVPALSPLTKTVSGAVGGARGIAGATGQASQALGRLAVGDVQGARALGQSALQKGQAGATAVSSGLQDLSKMAGAVALL